MVSDPSTDNIVSWDDDGRGFEVHSREGMEDVVLGKYFKHNQFSSWTRQCNMYGFAKDKRPGVWRFSHPGFVRGVPEKLTTIVRKGSSSSGASALAAATGATAQQLRAELHHLRSQRDELSDQVAALQARTSSTGTTLDELRQENQRLWSMMRSHEQSQAQLQHALHSIMGCLVQHGARLDGAEPDEAAELAFNTVPTLSLMDLSDEDEAGVGDVGASTGVAEAGQATKPSAVRPPALSRAFVPAPVVVGNFGSSSGSGGFASGYASLVLTPTPTQDGHFVFDSSAFDMASFENAWATPVKKRKTSSMTTVATSFHDDTLQSAHSPRVAADDTTAAVMVQETRAEAAAEALSVALTRELEDVLLAGPSTLDSGLPEAAPYPVTPIVAPQITPLAGSQASQVPVSMAAFPADESAVGESLSTYEQRASGAHNRDRDRGPAETEAPLAPMPQASPAAGNDDDDGQAAEELARCKEMEMAEELARRRELSAAGKRPVVMTPHLFATFACHVLAVLSSLAAERHSLLGAAPPAVISTRGSTPATPRSAPSPEVVDALAAGVAAARRELPSDMVHSVATQLYAAQRGYYGYDPSSGHSKWLTGIAPPPRPIVVLVS
ncbi:uncharacterized protein AMSG_08473 [Thecamonas trahens ATCC 50062]|uniref:HSF-type DNA-binding domain-containing protein n=1 Tax=Thecamonas trahens ATCC 50062 TaxID=461836 RepID=A0A0L0DK91_THETB|nr:hypothetical protein AMSG_08473 [Thecamonas trahens ATCC 50062]KNC52610.1 hypothetical protein AMSG_08473 [Thecamonas trahens ATCC 50062]|eukprot:XP_013755169.1 hypothetical protein AMSG_08473 [Thecamonas trahens ATCC 50062]